MQLLFFVYTTGWVTQPATAGATTQVVLPIANDYDFQCLYMTASIRQVGVLVTNWAGDVQVEDTGRGRSLFSRAIAVHAIGGTGQLPYPFNPPRRFVKNGSLTITFTNNVATATDIQLAFHGNKILEE